MAEHDSDAGQQQESHPVIQPQKIYIKDFSFETPNTPEIFMREWKPGIKIDLAQRARELQDGLFEVVLTLSVTAKLEDAIAYLAEVQQAGLFHMKGFDEDHLHRLVNIYCPRQLYPYASFAISDLVTRSGFPQLLLAPINFEQLYKNRMAESAASQQSTGH